MHEFIPYDKSKDVLVAVFKAQAETPKKQMHAHRKNGRKVRTRFR
jgi:hypothetical protein